MPENQNPSKTVIIPDVHNQHELAEEIIQRESPGMVVFLGDYFDDFADTVGDADHTSRWLKNSLELQNRIHLVGNHDLNYMTDNPNMRCSGYGPDKHDMIKRRCIPWGKLRPFHWVDDWLCTHAGLSNRFYMENGASNSVHEFLEMSHADLEMIHATDHPHTFLQVGRMRGGTSPTGGIVWCDYTEFVDIPGIRQIFGHTRNATVRHKKTDISEHYCIDTHLRHYAVYENHAMTIRPSVPETGA